MKKDTFILRRYLILSINYTYNVFTKLPKVYRRKTFRKKVRFKSNLVASYTLNFEGFKLQSTAVLYMVSSSTPFLVEV